MRWWLIGILVATTAAVAGTSQAALPPGLPAGYNFKALVFFVIEQRWTELEGSPTKPCSTWQRAVGSSYAFIEGLVPGHFSPTALPGSRLWAYLHAAGEIPRHERHPDPRDTLPGGPLQSRSNRQLEETGGVNWTPDCPTGRPPAFVPPPNDCEDKPDPTGSRKFGGFLSLDASRLKSTATLWEIQHGNEGAQRALTVTLVPRPAQWYRKCRVSRFGTDAPGGIRFPVDAPDLRKLSGLRAGKTFKYTAAYQWRQCVGADQMTEGETCRFKARGYIQFRRVGPNERFP